MLPRHTLRLIGILCIAMLLLACGRSDEQKIERHTERGDRYLSEQRYQEAVIEYLNVLQLDNQNVEVMKKLADASFGAGDGRRGMALLMELRALTPDDLEVREKLAAIYLLGGMPDEARREAEFILDRDPQRLSGLTLLGDAANTRELAESALQRLKEVESLHGHEEAYGLTMANLYAKSENLDEAERQARKVLETHPQSVGAHITLGNIHLLKRDLPMAEQHLTTAAGLASPATEARMRLVDFYLLTNRRDEARKILEEDLAEVPHAPAMQKRLGEIYLSENKPSEAMEQAEAVLARNPRDPEALNLRSRIHMVQGESGKAIADLSEVILLQPENPQPRYLMALANLLKNDVDQAKVSFRETLDLSPAFAPAALRLAELEIQTGNHQRAVNVLERFVRERDDLSPAYTLLTLGYLGTGDTVRASRAARRAMELAPEDPRSSYVMGLAYRQEGKADQATAEFEKALDLAPQFVEPLAQLVNIDLTANIPDEALERVKRQIEATPGNQAPLFYLLGQVHLARNEVPEAEQAYLKAIEVEPRMIPAYLALARLDAQRGIEGRAIERIESALEQDPENIAVLTYKGILVQGKGDLDGARDAYEKALAINPESAVAANNLAYLYSKFFDEPDKAFELAQRASRLRPGDPHISDTLGWIVYERGLYEWALRLLQESASKLPENAEVRYHLGMTQYQLGKKEEARESLERALALDPHFPGAEEARNTLKEL